MSETEDRITYKCKVCGFDNDWTRDKVLQMGNIEVMRSGEPQYETYSVPCQRPGFPRCSGRRLVKILLSEE
jgi:hypothetical protein